MKLIVFSSPNNFHSEIKPLIKMFKEGLEVFHLRKPKFSASEMNEYLELIPDSYKNRIVLHTHHKLAKKHLLKGIHLTNNHRKKKYSSNFKFTLLKLKHPLWTISRTCHRTHTIEEVSGKYTYIFLSPVYDSISKDSHAGNFSFRSIKLILPKSNKKVYALGGIEESKFEELQELGFYGVALLGTIWSTEKNPVDVFISARNKIEAMNLALA